jgi:hypothetical protein
MGGILVGGRMALAGASVPVLATSLHAQQPYWIGLLVHMASASMYPVFGWLRYPLGRAPDTPDVVTAKAWGAAALAIIAVLTSLAIFGSLDRELPWIGTDAQSDQSYISAI